MGEVPYRAEKGRTLSYSNRIAALTLGLGIALSGCYFNFDLGLGSLGRVSPLREVQVFDGDGPKLAIIEIEGLITASGGRTAFGSARPSMIARTREALKIAAEDEDVAGLLVRIASPGGTVTASETLHHLIESYRAETSKPVVAYLAGLATSGGYYVAVASDEVVSHPAAITGSIGVILSGFNVSGLMDRFGIADQTITSGAFKDTGSMTRPMRSDEREYMQTVIDDLFDRFKLVVREGRPGLDDETFARFSDGRIVTATRAKELGLVDKLGHIEDAVSALEARAGITDANVITYQRAGEYRENLYSRDRAPVHVDVDVLSIGPAPLAPGFYYIWPPAARRD